VAILLFLVLVTRRRRGQIATIERGKNEEEDKQKYREPEDTAFHLLEWDS